MYEIGKLYETEQSQQSVIGDEFPVIISGVGASITIYGSEQKPTTLADMQDIATGSSPFSEGVVRFNSLPRFISFVGNGDIDIGNCRLVDANVDMTPSYPPVIEDGNTVAWYLSDEPTTITKDASDFVSVWADKLGSGHDLLQATGASQPKWFDVDGVLFPGVQEFMKTLAFTYEQPEQIYIVFKQVSWASVDSIADGYNINSGKVYQVTNAPGIKVYAGNLSGENSNLPINTFGIARILIDGANSKFTINETVPIVGNFGTANMGGFTLGANGGNANWSNIQVKEILLRKIADTSQDEQDIYDYLALKHSI